MRNGGETKNIGISTAAADVRVHSHVEKCVMSGRKCARVAMGSSDSGAIVGTTTPRFTNSKDNSIAFHVYLSGSFILDRSQ